MPAPIVYDPYAGLRQGISQAGSALGSALGHRAQQQRRVDQAKEYGGILSSTIGALNPDASRMDVMQAFNSAISQGLPIDIAQNMGTLYKALADPRSSGGLGIQNEDELISLLKKFGMDDDQAAREAKLYMNLPQGGKTAYANYLFDRMQRGQLAPGTPQTAQQTTQISEQIPGADLSETETTEVEEYQFPEVDLFEGLNSKEKVLRQKELFNANAKDYAEVNKKYRGYEDEIRRLEQMEKINDSGKLPKNFSSLNVNWSSGNIRIPRFANEETQAFVKLVNDFTTKAKETFGARVTNFELGAFMKRLPTLANSEEGRRVILEQMKTTADLNKLYESSLKQVYDKYGLRGIDTQKAEKIAADLRKDDEQELIKRYKNSLQAQEVYEAKSLAPEGKVAVRNSEGKIGYIDLNKADKAKARGYEVL